jgi:hypothetical protein
MGTRALVILKEPDNTELTVIYSQWDGYPAGLGWELGEILGEYEVGNGIPGDKKVFSKPFANGIPELAMHLICELKAKEWEAAENTAKVVGEGSYPMPADQYPKQLGHKPGGYYLYPAGTRDTGEEWLYFVKEGEGGKVVIQVAKAENGMPDGKVVWEGLAGKLATKKVHRRPRRCRRAGGVGRRRTGGR